MPVDDAKARSSQRDRHARPRCVPGISDRVIHPYLAKRRIDIASVISTDKVDLAVVIARTHEGADIRHWRSGTPRICGNVIDARSIHHRGCTDLLTTEDEELVDIRRIHGGSRAVVQIRDGGKRRPRVGDWVEPAELVDIISNGEGVTAAFIRDGAIAVDEPAVVINPYWSGLRPRPRTASRCAGGRRRWRSRSRRSYRSSSCWRKRRCCCRTRRYCRRCRCCRR